MLQVNFMSAQMIASASQEVLITGQFIRVCVSGYTHYHLATPTLLSYPLPISPMSFVTILIPISLSSYPISVPHTQCQFLIRNVNFSEHTCISLFSPSQCHYTPYLLSHPHTQSQFSILSINSSYPVSIPHTRCHFVLPIFTSPYPM